MDQLQTRLDALEQQMCTITRRLRWWRGLAGGLLALSVLTWALPLGTAQEDAVTQGDKEKKGLEQRVAALESLLKHFSRKGNDVTITGANLHLVNGLGRTDCGEQQGEPIPDCPNGLGNLIVGYNEMREGEAEENFRTGSHNVVVGQHHNFSRVGGLVVGDWNAISGDFASVSGGTFSTASGITSAVSGGGNNTASGMGSAVSGGRQNTASDDFASVNGGSGNTAGRGGSAVSGGFQNTASGVNATVSGGQGNEASGDFAVVSGGGQDFFTGEGQGNRASGSVSVVSGGSGNTASGAFAVVSGGQNITQETAFGWSAGSEADEVVVGNFRSP